MCSTCKATTDCLRRCVNGSVAAGRAGGDHQRGWCSRELGLSLMGYCCCGSSVGHAPYILCMLAPHDTSRLTAQACREPRRACFKTMGWRAFVLLHTSWLMSMWSGGVGATSGCATEMERHKSHVKRPPLPTSPSRHGVLCLRAFRSVAGPSGRKGRDEGRGRTSRFEVGNFRRGWEASALLGSCCLIWV